LDSLRHRCETLETIIGNWPGSAPYPPHRPRAELAAIRWAIGIVERVAAAGVLHDYDLDGQERPFALAFTQTGRLARQVGTYSTTGGGAQAAPRPHEQRPRDGWYVLTLAEDEKVIVWAHGTGAHEDQPLPGLGPA